MRGTRGTKRLLLAATVALFAGASLSCGAAAPQHAANGRGFSISSDPAGAVVSITVRGGLTNVHLRYALYGDGRFVSENRTPSGDLLSAFETTVPDDEVREIVAVAVSAGLMDMDAKELDARVATIQQADPERAHIIINDSGEATYTISLASYSRGGVSTGSITRTYRQSAAKIMAKIFPEVPELEGLAELSARLHELAMQAHPSDLHR